MMADHDSDLSVYHPLSLLPSNISFPSDFDHHRRLSIDHHSNPFYPSIDLPPSILNDSLSSSHNKIDDHDNNNNNNNNNILQNNGSSFIVHDRTASDASIDSTNEGGESLSMTDNHSSTNNTPARFLQTDDDLESDMESPISDASSEVSAATYSALISASSSSFMNSQSESLIKTVPSTANHSTNPSSGSSVASTPSIDDRSTPSSPIPLSYSRIIKKHHHQKDRKNPEQQRVSIWNKKEQRKISGFASPMLKNLTEYLQKHPDCVIYEGRMNKNKRSDRSNHRNHHNNDTDSNNSDSSSGASTPVPQESNEQTNAPTNPSNTAPNTAENTPHPSPELSSIASLHSTSLTPALSGVTVSINNTTKSASSLSSSLAAPRAVHHAKTANPLNGLSLPPPALPSSPTNTSSEGNRTKNADAPLSPTLSPSLLAPIMHTGPINPRSPNKRRLNRASTDGGETLIKKEHRRIGPFDDSVIMNEAFEDLVGPPLPPVEFPFDGDLLHHQQLPSDHLGSDEIPHSAPMNIYPTRMYESNPPSLANSPSMNLSGSYKLKSSSKPKTSHSPGNKLLNASTALDRLSFEDRFDGDLDMDHQLGVKRSQRTSELPPSPPFPSIDHSSLLGPPSPPHNFAVDDHDLERPRKMENVDDEGRSILSSINSSLPPPIARSGDNPTAATLARALPVTVPVPHPTHLAQAIPHRRAKATRAVPVQAMAVQATAAGTVTTATAVPVNATAATVRASWPSNAVRATAVATAVQSRPWARATPATAVVASAASPSARPTAVPAVAVAASTAVTVANVATAAATAARASLPTPATAIAASESLFDGDDHLYLSPRLTAAPASPPSPIQIPTDPFGTSPLSSSQHASSMLISPQYSNRVGGNRRRSINRDSFGGLMTTNESLSPSFFSRTINNNNNNNDFGSTDLFSLENINMDMDM